MNKILILLKNYRLETIIFVLALIFSSWLMFSSFSYSGGNMIISSKSWSDFASHIPLIRSFSFGNNFPPVYPLFPGPPIKYHFLFFLFAGILEKLGFRIDFALNIPSILGFSSLILMIYLFAKEIFKSKAVGILSIFLFLFNSSLSFINFFAKFPLSLNSINDIISSKTFTNFGPYDGGIISAFWNLNIYTNQRHLAASYALSLFIIYIFLRFNAKEKNRDINLSILLGIILGISFILNMAVFLMTISILFLMMIFLKDKRLYIFTCLFTSAIISLPFYLFMQSGSTPGITLYPGYLVTNLNLKNFLNYWFQNLGINLILIPLGFVFAKKLPKKIFISFFSLFIIGNLFKFSPEIAANHKFFNYFMIVGGMFTAYFLLKLWSSKTIIKPLIIVLIFFLTFSGILDFFPILNDGKITLADYPSNKSIAWIIKNTNPKSNFLNNQYLYNYANLAGRSVFLGWPYFAWSQGYDTNQRDELRKKILNTTSLTYFCKNVSKYNLNYIDINTDDKGTIVNMNFLNRNFQKIFENKKENFVIYNINSKC